MSATHCELSWSWCICQPICILYFVFCFVGKGHYFGDCMHSAHSDCTALCKKANYQSGGCLVKEQICMCFDQIGDCFCTSLYTENNHFCNIFMLSVIHLCLPEDYIHVFVSLPCAVTLMSDCLPVRDITPWLEQRFKSF